MVSFGLRCFDVDRLGKVDWLKAFSEVEDFLRSVNFSSRSLELIA
jgi:hypothetical protein